MDEPLTPADVEQLAKTANRRFTELEAYVLAEVDRLNSENQGLNLAVNLATFSIVCLTIVVYFLQKDLK